MDPPCLGPIWSIFFPTPPSKSTFSFAGPAFLRLSSFSMQMLLPNPWVSFLDPLSPFGGAPGGSWGALGGSGGHPLAHNMLKKWLLNPQSASRNPQKLPKAQNNLPKDPQRPPKDPQRPQHNYPEVASNFECFLNIALKTKHFKISSYVHRSILCSKASAGPAKR